MPLIIMAGYPCSGKTTRSKEIKKYLEDNCGRKVSIVSETDALIQSCIEKNKFVFDTKKQKEVRANLKSNVARLLGSDVVILDASNNIKGYRYELYCAAKSHKTTHVIVDCDISKEKAWELNEARAEDNKYDRVAFDALIALHEPVNSSNRWDFPLVTIQLDDPLPGNQVHSLLFNRNAPKPNQSTENVPLCSSNYLSDLDKVTKDVINNILDLRNNGVMGKNVKLPNIDAELLILDDRLNDKKLANLKRQFISYCKLNPSKDSKSRIAKMFVQFVNSSS